MSNAKKHSNVTDGLENDLSDLNVVELKNIRKSFGEHTVLYDVSIRLKQGEIVALLGQSGSGKSTLLRCVNLLTTPEAGEIFFAGKRIDFTSKKNNAREFADVEQVRNLRQNISMVFQQFQLWSHRTVIQNVAEAPIHVLKLNKGLAYERAGKLLEKVGLGSKKDSYPRHLSGGQQQRVGIARALAVNPMAILFDEPTSALDPESTREVLAVMRDLAQEGTSMIIATHEIGFAKEVATRAVFLDKGKLLEEGRPDDILSSPRTEALRKFLEAVID